MAMFEKGAQLTDISHGRLAFSYVRMSTERQLKGDSLRRQLEWSQAYASTHGLVLDDDGFQDLGVSAWKGNNSKKGELGEFLLMVKEGLVPVGSYLLVESLDRLSRTQVLDALELFTGILRSGINIVTMGPPEQHYTWRGLNGDFGQLIITLTIMARAHEESERKSTRIRASFENKRNLSRAGFKTNQRPPSWITPTKIEKGIFSYKLNERADLIRWMFEQSASGIGYDKIARMLNEKAEATLRPSLRGWWYTNVRNVIENRAAIGEYQSLETRDGKYVPKGDPIADYYPPVVSNDLFIRAQKIPHQNRKGGRSGTSYSNLFTGLCTCRHCGSIMYMQNNSRSKHQFQYLVCSANWRKQMVKSSDGATVPLCTEGNFRFRYQQAEQFVLDNIDEFGMSELMRLRRSDDELRQINEESADLTVRLNLLRKTLKRFAETFENENEADLPDLVALMKSRQAEAEVAQERLSSLAHERALLLAKQTQLDPASSIKAMREQWQNVDDTTRYTLRVRCNNAMREFIDFISFDSAEASYTAVLFGGLRAYKFFNVATVRKATQKPEIVDMSLFVNLEPQQYDVADATRLRAAPFYS